MPLADLLRIGRGRCYCGETAALNSSLRCIAACSATTLHGYAIAAAGAGNRAAGAARSAGPIPITGSPGKIKRADRSDIGMVAAMGVQRNSIGVAEAAGLHLAGRHLR